MALKAETGRLAALALGLSMWREDCPSRSATIVEESPNQDRPENREFCSEVSKVVVQIVV